MKFQYKKSLGQHFLNNERVAVWMADAANVTNGDIVLEIGPGIGALTKELLSRGAAVIAVEADERAIKVLQETFVDELASGQLVLHHADARVLDLQMLGITAGGYKLVANIPYYISGFLFRTFLETELQPLLLVFLVQKEVAKRIAREEKESLLSLGIKAYGVPEYVRTVPRGHFTPQPKVDSAIIAVRDISKKHFKALDEQFFFELLHLGFSSKRKQLVGNFAKRFDKKLLMNMFSTLGIPQDARAEDLPLEIWLRLAEVLEVHT